jgi:hypothetical protein
MRNPSRDYMLLNEASDDGDAEKAQQGSVSSSRLFSLAKAEVPTLMVATGLLLITSLTQVGWGNLPTWQLSSWQPMLSSASPLASIARMGVTLFSHGGPGERPRWPCVS